jgi:hypothetical protein
MMENFENTVHDWFSAVTGLEVIWREQSAPLPKFPFGTLKILAGPTRLGRPTVQEKESVGRGVGEEVEIKAVVPCSMSVSCQVFAGGRPDASNPNYNARVYANKAMTNIEMPSVWDTFRRAGITIMNVGEIKNLDALVESEHESRAGLDILFGITLTESEFTGYIETVHIRSTNLKIDRDFPVGHL